jgi:hypothetical protein
MPLGFCCQGSLLELGTGDNLLDKLLTMSVLHIVIVSFMGLYGMGDSFVHYTPLTEIKRV